MSPGQDEFEVSCTPPPAEEGAPLWTVTFGDLMSLLLTFFILLFSMSELRMERFMLASQSMRQAMGGTSEAEVADPMGLVDEPSDPALNLQSAGSAEAAVEAVGRIAGEASEIETLVDAYMKMITSRLEGFVSERGLDDAVSIERDGEGVYLRMQTAALFPSGTAALQPEGRAALAELAEITSGINVRVLVSGHADDQPITGGPFPSNWELSAARAAGVARELVRHGQDPLTVRAESYGEHRPIASNDTPEGRALNRRVELMYARADILAAVKSWARLAEVHVDLPSEDTVPGPGG